MALHRLVLQAQEIVPERLKVGVASTADGLTFTFVASSEVVATLDALQCLDGGRFVEAVRGGTLRDGRRQPVRVAGRRFPWSP